MERLRGCSHGAKGRGAACADPFIATFVALVLFFEALFQLLRNFSQPPRALISPFLLPSGIFPSAFSASLPEFRQFRLRPGFQVFEHFTEYAVELAEITLVLHQRGAREVVEVFR